MAKTKAPTGEEKLPLYIEDLPEAVILTDTSNVITAVNAVARKILGYDRESPVGLLLDKVLPATPKGLAKLVAGQVKHLSFEAKALTRGGRKVSLDFVAFPLSRDGQVVAVGYLGRDTRVHTLIETEIRKARNYFRAIVENFPYGVCVTDLDRRIVIANEAAKDITGYRADELIGEEVGLFYGSEGGKTDIDLAALRQGELITKELQFRKKDGGELPVRVKYRLMEDIDEPGKEVIFETYSDLTDRRRLDQLRNEFVFVAAHELRNPVTAIRLLTDIIFEDKRLTMDPILRHYLQSIQEANHRLLQLVDDLLEVSRSESGKLKIQVGPLNIMDHVNATLSEIKPSAVNKDVSLVYEPRGPLPQVLADPAKLREIISNLLTNAVKYNVAGGSVTLTHEVLNGQLITHVTDTGIGISQSDIGQLFQKFWRSDDVAVRAQAGTGLGLFIVKELVTRMGGDIVVKSELGKGTTFSFSLPIKE